ncbi:MAG TPA: hypothetical protein VK206_11340, partial [Anaerolineales bacterium]|nr:hypothetical protein [Anaerolineales bacterium]
LEVNPEQQTIYHLHAVLRDAVPRDALQEAYAHAAAAQWFGQSEFNAEDLSTWDDTLYHLRRAAEIGRQPEFLEPYQSFVFDNVNELENAGWGRRNVSELQVLDELISETSIVDRFLVHWLMGIELWLLGEDEAALDLFRELSDALTAYLEIPAEENAEIVELLLLVNAKLGSTLVSLGEYEEARKYADGMEPLVTSSQSLQHKLRYAELRFDIVRKVGEPPEMLHWADECFKIATQWVEEENTSQTLNALAEAHFNLAIAHLQLDHQDEALKHFISQLRLKAEIGRLSGLGAGLFNLGVMFRQSEPMAAAAMLLTAEQIQYEIGAVQREWEERDFAQLYHSFLADPANFVSGRDLLLLISNKLLPYYLRMLERRTGAPVHLPPE